MRREKVSSVVGADTRWPCVVLAHGFSGTMDRLLPHAEQFPVGGIAALVFDYRGFGESGGEPRQVVDLPSQQQDLRAAISWVRGHHDLDPDRVALWGNSLGGAHVISVAANDPGIAAVVAQIPGTHFDFYTDPSVRDRALADQLGFLDEHLHVSPRAA